MIVNNLVFWGEIFRKKCDKSGDKNKTLRLFFQIQTRSPVILLHYKKNKAGF